MEFVDAVCNEVGVFPRRQVSNQRSQMPIQIKVIKLLANTLKPVEKEVNGFFTSIFDRIVKNLIFWSFVLENLVFLSILLLVYHGLQT